MTTDNLKIDKAGNEYWDKNWSATELPAAFDPYDGALENTFYARVHKYFEKLIDGRKGLKILEIGCAHSVWPLYFTTYHSAHVDGLDYSETGCRKTQQMWDAQGLTGKITCADMFAPPPELLGQYDLVVSFGVVEHFRDTAACLKACAAFVRPGGQLFTMIPNMAGLPGILQKHVDRAIYDIHMPLSRKMLDDAHARAGLGVADSRYFMAINLNVVNSGRLAGRPVDKLLRRAFSIPTKLVWIAEKSGVRLPANGVTSPYILALARTIP